MHPRVVLHDQAAITAYRNSSGELVIQQRDTPGLAEARDYVRPENIEQFLEGLFDRARPRKKPPLVSALSE
jgi:hypothetical protein